MARSQSIWVVEHKVVPRFEIAIAACFTVKHEMITWLKNQEDPKQFIVMRFPDNPRENCTCPSNLCKVVTFDVREFGFK
jgi:hypothetical protein